MNSVLYQSGFSRQIMFLCMHQPLKMTSSVIKTSDYKIIEGPKFPFCLGKLLFAPFEWKHHYNLQH